MTRLVPNLAGALLGLLFVVFGLMFLLGLVPEQPPPPEGSVVAMYMGAMGPTGYLAFVKVCEVLGGVLVAVPRTRVLGLLVLGPIVVNILAFHWFIGGKEGLADPILIGICALLVFLLGCEWRAFVGLVSRRRNDGRGAVR